jgi:hypothetical protein
MRNLAVTTFLALLVYFSNAQASGNCTVLNDFERAVKGGSVKMIREFYKKEGLTGEGLENAVSEVLKNENPERYTRYLKEKKALALTQEATEHQTVVFSKNGQRVENFKEVITNVKSGDQLHFSDGANFKIKTRLGGEASTEIFETSDGKVIRVNKRSKDTGAWTVDSYRKGHEELKSSEIPIVHVMDPANTSRDYVVVEKFNKKYDLNELHKKFLAREIPQSEYQEKMMEFEKFIVKTKDYTSLEDFHPGQVVYDEKRGWLLADYGAENTKFTGAGSGTAVDGWGSYLPQAYVEHFQGLIRGARQTVVH